MDVDDYIDVFKEHLENSDFILGKSVGSFENTFAKIHGVDHCIGCADGTSAIYLAIKALELSPSDEVIVPANTWISSASAVSNAGSKVVFCDVEKHTYGLCLDSIAKKITENTKAIIIVHMYGLPADVVSISEFCNERGLYLIEDCSQAHFATVNSKLVGTFGDISTFSFFPGKIIGAFGDGGAVLTKHKTYAERIRLIARNGSKVKGCFITEGINSRLDSLQASILSIKLRRHEDIIKRRRQLAEKISVGLSDIKDLILPHHIYENRKNSYNYYVVRHPKRDELAKHLKLEGISSQVHYPIALPFQQAYQKLGALPKDYPISHKLQSEVLSLPFYVGMEDEKVNYLCKKISAFINTTQQPTTM